MRYMLETDIASYVIRRRPTALLERFSREADHLCVSVITEAELRFGVEKRQSDALNQAVDAFLARLRVFEWDREAAVAYGRLRARLDALGRPIGNMDLMIAAHAMAKGLTVVTNNERHFAGIEGLITRNWVD